MLNTLTRGYALLSCFSLIVNGCAYWIPLSVLPRWSLTLNECTCDCLTLQFKAVFHQTCTRKRMHRFDWSNTSTHMQSLLSCCLWIFSTQLQTESQSLSQRTTDTFPLFVQHSLYFRFRLSSPFALNLADQSFPFSPPSRARKISCRFCTGTWRFTAQCIMRPRDLPRSRLLWRTTVCCPRTSCSSCCARPR